MTETVIMISEIASKLAISGITLTLFAVALGLDVSVAAWLKERRERQADKETSTAIPAH